MLLLLASLLGLAVGPVAYHLAQDHRRMLSLIDGFVFVTITGIVLVTILPESLAQGSVWTIPFALAGFFLPTLAERTVHGAQRTTHAVALSLGFTGLAVHGMLDGAGLAAATGAAGAASLMGTGILIHRIPVGFTVWWLLRPALGTAASTAVLGLIAAGTLLGWGLGPVALDFMSAPATAWFQATVAGSLLHVVFHRPAIPKHVDGLVHSAAAHRRYEGAGAILGVAFLVVVAYGGGGAAGIAHLDPTEGAARTFIALALESAPALVLAYFAAGFVSAFMPRSSVAWMNRGGSVAQAARGMTVGLPLPICSCGVIPLYRALIKGGAPPAAAMAFLVATPELGLDAIFLSVPLLGGPMTLIRVIGATIVALAVGSLVGRTVRARSPEEEPGTTATAPTAPTMDRVRQALRVGLGEAVDHTAPWILLGLAVAAAIAPFMESGWLTGIPWLWQVPLFAVLGMPTYVCASAATPFVAALLAGGVSPGAALAFLLTGPATNATTFGVLTQLHGRRPALAFSAAIVGLSVGLGYAIDLLLNVDPIPLSRVTPETASPLQVMALAFLTIIVLASLFRRGARAFVGEIKFGSGGPAADHSH